MDALVEGELTLQIKARNISPMVETGLQKWGKHIHQDDVKISMTIESEADIPAINRYLVDQGVDVYAFSPQNVSLEDLFLQVVDNDDTRDPTTSAKSGADNPKPRSTGNPGL